MKTMDFKKQNETFHYQLLSRLQLDCEYFLGHGNRSEKHLWSGNVKKHIEDMKALLDTFANDKKPDWISLNDILEYEKQMK